LGNNHCERLGALVEGFSQIFGHDFLREYELR
jgi:hypothetical protein